VTQEDDEQTRLGKIPYTSLIEQALVLWLEYHPWVATYQRGDVSTEFVSKHSLSTVLDTPYIVKYVYGDAPHDYFPDFVGTLLTGVPFIAEGGLYDSKIDAQSLAKAEMARRKAHIQGGHYWIGTENLVHSTRYWNLIFLHPRRLGFVGFHEIGSAVREFWAPGKTASVREVTQLLSNTWSAIQVQAAAWKIVGDAAALGYLLVDLDEVVLDLDTPIALVPPGELPIIPDPLPEDLILAEDTHKNKEASEGDAGDDEYSIIRYFEGPTINHEALPSEKAAKFLNNRRAAIEIVEGKPLGQVAAVYNIDASNLSRMVQRAKEIGEIAFVPNGTHQRESKVDPAFRALIRRLYKDKRRLRVMAILEHEAMRKLAKDLTKERGLLVNLPSYHQVWRLVEKLKNEPDVVDARSGLKHPPKRPQSTRSYVLSIRAPGSVCQVDEAYYDVKVVTSKGVVITYRIHGAALICVKTGAVLSAVVSPKHLTEDDYMRLIKQGMEAKDRLLKLYGCKHRWPCRARPSVILCDRGLIFTSARATQVLVERLGIIQEIAPPYAPSVKGTVEALWKWAAEKFFHRLRGTTMSNIQERGAYDTDVEAEEAGLTFDLIEEYLTRAIVDGYMQEWDELRGGTRIDVWDEADRRWGTPQWLGSANELKLLLMKSVNRKAKNGKYAIHRNGISFRGRWYRDPTVLEKLINQEVEIRYDRSDIGVLYIYHQNTYQGAVYCIDLNGRRLSEWEADAERKANRHKRQAATEESRANRTEIYDEANKGKKAQQAKLRRLEKARQHDQQRSDVHLPEVQATLEALQVAAAHTQALAAANQGDAVKKSLPSRALFALPTAEDEFDEASVLPVRSRHTEVD
jgi:hypothetical protein